MAAQASLCPQQHRVVRSEAHLPRPSPSPQLLSPGRPVASSARLSSPKPLAHIYLSVLRTLSTHLVPLHSVSLIVFFRVSRVLLLP